MCIQKLPVNAFKFQQYGFGKAWNEGISKLKNLAGKQLKTGQ